MKKLIGAFQVFCLLCLISASLYGEQKKTLPHLFRELQSEETTDAALGEFLRLGPSNAGARNYLAAHLSAAIDSGPKGHPHVWMNSVRLAGAFRLREAVPSLTKWIGLLGPESFSSTFAEMDRLDLFPSGKALVEIGEPAVPTLVGVLDKGDRQERWVAYRALFLIGSSRAIGALRDHLMQESDPDIKKEIQEALPPFRPPAPSIHPQRQLLSTLAARSPLATT